MPKNIAAATFLVQYQQAGSVVIVPKGDVDIHAKTVNILAGQETARSTQESKFRQSGLTVSLSAPVLAAAKTAGQMARATQKLSSADPRMLGLAGAATGLAGKNALDAVKADPSSLGGVTVSLTVGASGQDSRTERSSGTAVPSTVLAGKDARISATGASADSDLTVRGSTIQAGGALALKADGDIALLAAQNMEEMTRKNSSFSVGVATSVGNGGASIGLTANAAVGRGKADGHDLAWTHTDVSAEKGLTMSSSGDTTLRGAVVSGRQVMADVGGNLDIESLQDKSTYTSRDQNIGGSVTVGAGVSGSATVGQQKMDSDYASVAQQSGIQAGDGGFRVTVEGNTNLKGGAIASTQKAVDEERNSLTTGSLTFSDIENYAEFSASSMNLGAGFSSKERAADGQKKSDDSGAAAPGVERSKGPKLTATLPVVMGASGSDTSVTRSGVSGGVLTLTDNARHAQSDQAGKDTLTGLNRDVRTGDSTNALSRIFDEEDIKARFEIVGAVTRETGVWLDNKGKEVDAAQLAAKDPMLTSEERDHAQQRASQLNHDWGSGGSYRRAATALAAAASGNVMSNASQFAINATVNYVQGLAVSEVKRLADGMQSESARAALHAIVGCAGAAASQQACGAGALGAATSSVLGSLLGSTAGLSAQEKEAQTNLVASLVSG